MCVKNYENWPAVDKVIAKKYQAYFFLAHPVDRPYSRSTGIKSARLNHPTCTVSLGLYVIHNTNADVRFGNLTRQDRNRFFQHIFLTQINNVLTAEQKYNHA